MIKHVILWTFRSTELHKDWRSWECLALTKDELLGKCLERYGRVPSDCVPVEVVEFDVPEVGWFERGIVLSQVFYAKAGVVKYFENTIQEENERIRISNLKYRKDKQ